MKRVSIHVDYDSIREMESGLTPSLLAQRMAAAAQVLGHVGGRWCYGTWSQLPASVRDSFESEGWRCADPLASPDVWRDFKDSVGRDRAIVSDLVVVVVSSNKTVSSRDKELRDLADEIVLWHGGDRPPNGREWDRIDSLPRVLGLVEPSVAVVVDVPGLVASTWSAHGMVDIESVLEALERATARVGPVVTRVALADWHTLPVMRNRDGEPITHEAELVFRRAGYGTPAVPPISDREPLPEEVTAVFDRLATAQDLILVGRTPVIRPQMRLLEPKASRVHLWSDERPDVPEWVSWRSLAAVLEQPPATALPWSADDHLVPGLWCRIGLLTDKVTVDSGADAIGAGDLVAAMVRSAPYVRRPDQALALIAGAVRRGTLREMASPDGGETRYRINDDDPGIAFLRTLLRTLIGILGEGVGEGNGLPSTSVLDALVSSTDLGGTRPLDRTSLMAWVNFLVDEGILLRFQGASAEGSLVPCLAFSPSPLKDVAVPPPSQSHAKTPSRLQRTATAVRVPPKLRDYVIMAVDNYALRHGRGGAPMAALRKALGEFGGPVVEAAVREGSRLGDLHVPRGTPSTVSVSNQSKYSRLVIGRKNRAISMLKQMAPMGQPIGEARIKKAFLESLNLRDDEAGDLLSFLFKERILRRESQIVTSGGPSYTLSLDDAAVVRAHEHAMSRDSTRRRFGGEHPRAHARSHRGRERGHA